MQLDLIERLVYTFIVFTCQFMTLLKMATTFGEASISSQSRGRANTFNFCPFWEMLFWDTWRRRKFLLLMCLSRGISWYVFLCLSCKTYLRKKWQNFHVIKLRISHHNFFSENCCQYGSPRTSNDPAPPSNRQGGAVLYPDHKHGRAGGGAIFLAGCN